MKNLLVGPRVGGLLICLILSVQAAAGQQGVGASGNPTARQLTTNDALRLTMKGSALSPEKAERLEQKLASDPQDLETRLTLIGYYSTRYDESFRLKKREQALWVIQNIPDSGQLRNVVFAIVRLNQDEEGFEEAKQSVIKYFQLCASFWTNRSELKHWSAIVRERGIPDFGANLDY